MRALPLTIVLFASFTLGCFIFRDDGIVPRPDTFFVDDFIDSSRPDSDLRDTEDSPEEVWTRHEYNFDELSAGLVDAAYPEMSFSASDGLHMVVYPATTLARSQPNCLYLATDAGQAGSAADFTLHFTQPVRELRFFASGDSLVGPAANLVVTLEDDETFTVPLVTDGSPTTAELVDLSAYAGVVSVGVRQMADPNGLAYDDMSFEMREP